MTATGKADFNASQPRTLHLPDTVPQAGLLIGWSLDAEAEKAPWGFSFGAPELSPGTGFLDPILLAGEGHLVTIAPTGQGKGRCCIIPALLRHAGPVIVIDPKGENAAVTAAHRRKMGQSVVILDPFGVSGTASDAFNPLDIIEADSVESSDLAASFAHALGDRSGEDPRNAYWYQRSTFLLSGLILHVCCGTDPARRTFAEVRRLLGALASEPFGSEEPPGGVVAALAASPHPGAREVVSMLRSSARDGLGSILSMAEDAIGFLRGPQVEAGVGATSFDLAAVTRGDPMSIYLVVPPHLLESHGMLLRMWVMALISLITRRRARPTVSTLFLLDEAAQLGPLRELRQAVTLLRGYGVQTWSFWQDVSQLQRLYPADWQTIVNNCAVLQCFGAQNRMAAGGMASLTGYGGPDGADAILGLNPYEMILQMGGRPPVLARKPDYLSDPVFAGSFGDNPFHDPARDIMPPPAARLNLFAKPSIMQPPPPAVPHGGPWAAGTVIDGDVMERVRAMRASRQREPATSSVDPLLERLFALWEDAA